MRLKGKLTRRIKGVSDDHMYSDCTWGRQGKISMSKRVDYNNLNSGWENSAISVAEMICQQAYDQLVLKDRTCK